MCRDFVVIDVLVETIIYKKMRYVQDNNNRNRIKMISSRFEHSIYITFLSCDIKNVS